MSAADLTRADKLLTEALRELEALSCPDRDLIERIDAHINRVMCTSPGGPDDCYDIDCPSCNGDEK